MNPDEPFRSIGEALRLAAATLRDADVPFVLGGSFAAWARGGPQPQNDLDLMVKPAEAERALEALAAVGMRTEKPPEEWLFKAWHGDVMIDLIFHPAGLEMSDEVLARADTMPVMAVATPVMALEDMLSTKLCSLNEHSLNFSPLLGIARALREQINWRELHERVRPSPYAEAFFTLIRELEVVPELDEARGPAHSRVRVLPHAEGGTS